MSTDNVEKRNSFNYGVHIALPTVSLRLTDISEKGMVVVASMIDSLHYVCTEYPYSVEDQR